MGGVEVQRKPVKAKRAPLEGGSQRAVGDAGQGAIED
jgi:hypothetical protein